MDLPASPFTAGPDAASEGVRVPALCRAIRAGDDASFTHFYERHFDLLFAMTRTFTRRDESYCLDIVHDTMLRVIRSIPELSSWPEVHAWLRRTMISCVIDRARNDARRERRENRVAASEIELAPHAELAWLRDRLRELSPDDQALIALRFGNGATLESIATLESTTLGTIQGRIRRALAKLRALVEAGEP
jgi:RNA polymerase sigma factor (sigma-70 family)